MMKYPYKNVDYYITFKIIPWGLFDNKIVKILKGKRIINPHA